MKSVAFLSLVTMLVVMALLTEPLAALPAYGLGHHHHRGHRRHLPNIASNRRADEHGDVVAHDDYEAQVRALQAALEHFEQYGDAHSLETYLKGFVGNSGDAGPGVSANTDDQEEGSGGKDDDEHVDGKQDKDDGCDDGALGDDKEGATQPVQEPKMVKRPKKKQPHHTQKPSGDYADSKSEPQPHPQPQPEKPKPQAQTPAVSKPEGYDPNTPSTPSHSGNAINGYAPPPFSTSRSPSIASLYTAPPFVGRATYYKTGLGACGIINSEHDPIVAVSSDVFEQYLPHSGNSNHNSLCGKKVEISWKGKTIHAFAMDECPGCHHTSLDLSPVLFNQLDNPNTGVLDGISWRLI